MNQKIGIARLVTLFFLMGLSTFAPAAAGDTCVPAVEMSHGTWRGHTMAQTAPCWRLDVDSMAVLTVATAMPLTAPVEPLLRIAGGQTLSLEMSMSHQVFLLPQAGTFFVYLEAQEAVLPLDGYRVLIDVNETLMAKATEEQEIEPDRALSRCQEDDHGDTTACPTPLDPGGIVSGELANAWGDDIDVFGFELSEPRRVLIETIGPTDTLGVLDDHRGYRLAIASDGGEDGNFRLRKALLPGRYFIRLQGEHAALGPYRLRLATESW